MYACVQVVIIDAVVHDMMIYKLCFKTDGKPARL